MPSKYMKKCSSFLAIKEMQIKSTLWFHLTPVRTAIIKGKNNNKFWWGYGKTRTFLHCWW
jgi:beta-mannanase